MSFAMAVRLALKGIVANKMRTFLTMLGIIIGVSAVIILVSVGRGTTASVTENIQSMGTNLVTVMITGRGINNSLTYEEAMSMSEKTGVSGVAPVASGSITAKYGTKTMEDVSLEGVNGDYAQVRNQGVQSGRFILPLDVEYRQKVAVLGIDVVNEIFGSVNPIGETVQIDGIDYRVIGVLESKGSSMQGSSDEKVIIPITTAQRMLKSEGVRNIYVAAESPEVVTLVVAEIEQYLLKKFDQDEDAYRVFNQTEMLDTVNEVSQSMTLMLGGIAGISLLVGGIGIMNIMLVTVTERTREIGIRKAIGAKRKDILRQFLLESATISGVGGIIGVLFGLGVNKLLTKLAGINTQSTLAILVIAFSFSLVVGIFFGLYPANKASKLKPVDALRFE
ncbi:ABC transporter permease [Candidatus Formimonas warabiya]|uniref:ABC transporter permease n=1 Tax=Formimonas warabiya TaxID=1761012 RepID=A0A3G1KPJ4_FORW1|nr:ABC transporter permease [Candidatus Formimonas warabiya]ATW24389.1 ABC transporter permease [Candidatus Formimonas warabiya]